jgi:hypothetical protein
MKKNTSLRARILFLVLSVSLLTGLAIGAFTYFQSSFIMLRELRAQSVISIQSAYDLYLKTLLKGKESELIAISKSVSADYVADAEEAKAWGFYLTVDQEVSSVYFGSADGAMLIIPQADLGKGYDPRKRVWYQAALISSGKVVWTDPYLDLATKQTVVSAVLSVQSPRRMEGVFGIDILLSQLSENLAKINLGKGAKLLIIDHTGLVLADSSNTLVGQILDESKGDYVEALSAKQAGNYTAKFSGISCFVPFMSVPDTGWKLIGVIPVGTYHNKTLSILTVTLITCLGAFAIAFILGWIVTSRFIKGIAQVSRNLRISAQELETAATQLSSSSLSISSGAQEQASGIEEISSSIQQLETMVKTNRQGSTTAKELTREARDASGQGEQRMQDLAEAMSSINSSAEGIKAVIDVIDDIAFQTNMLALNAAVEAARAGEAGMGFAVVADEVKSLANRSSDSAKQTSLMIKEAISNVGKGITLSNEMSELFHVIVSKAEKAAAMSQEVETSGSRQEDGIGQVKQAVNQLNAVVQSNASASEETAANAEGTKTQANKLMEAVMSLESIVSGDSRQRETA